jgi:hypothetical protein
MLKYSAKHRGFVDQDEAWKKIVSLYQGGEVSIAALATRFQLTNQAIRDGLKKRGVLETSSRLKRKNLCGTSASPA